MAALNVRNLISRFEQLTSGFEKCEPKTPLTPKISVNRAFFPETNYVQNNSSNVKLLKIEEQILGVKKQVRVIEEVSNDDFVKILFSMLNLLIALAAIEVEGNFNVKQRKKQCFNDIIDCKDELVRCLDEDFAVQNGIVSSSFSQERTVLFEGEIARSSVELEDGKEDIEGEVIQVQRYVEEPKMFCAVSKMTNFFESRSKDSNDVPKPNIKDYFGRNSAPINVENEDTAAFDELSVDLRESNLQGNSPKKSDSDNSTSSELSEAETVISADRRSSDERIFESTSEIKLSSVKNIRNMFEAKSTENISKARSSTTLDKLIQDLDKDEEHTGNAQDDQTNDDKSKSGDKINQQQTINQKDDQTVKEASVEKQKALMETLSAELQYYESLISTMEPDDEVRAEVLEENLVEMFFEINRFQTCGDPLLQTQKQDAINLAQLLQSKINEKKTNIGSYFNDLQEGERRKSQLPPAGDFEAILIEVERYKDLVSKFDSTVQDKANGAFLEENICEVLLLLDNYQPDDDDERNKKMRAIKDLGLILNELTAKKETKEEKHLIAVCSKSPHEDQNNLITDGNFKNYIAVCPPAPDNYFAVCPPAPENYIAVCPPAPENYFAVCPPAPENYKAGVHMDDKVAVAKDPIINCEIGVGKESKTVDDVSRNKHFKDVEDDDSENYNFKDIDDEISTIENVTGEDSTMFKDDPEIGTFKDVEDSNYIITQEDDLNIDDEFNDLVKETLASEVAEATARLKDVCVEVNIFKNILKELQIFDEEELDIFKRNVAELEDVLINLQCGGDAELELRRKETLIAVREIQDGLDKFKA